MSRTLLTDIKNILNDERGAVKGTQEWSPSELGLDGVDLKAADGTRYKGTEIDLRGASRIYIYISWTITGAATVGTIRFDWIPTDEDGNELKIADVTTNKTATSSDDASLFFPPGADAQFAGHGVGSASEAPRTVRGKPAITVITQSDAATSAVASVRIVAAV